MRSNLAPTPMVPSSRRRLSLALASLLLPACSASGKFLPMNPSPRQVAARSVESVQMYSSKRPVADYVEIGIIEAHNDWTDGDAIVAFRALRKRAAVAGCDAVIDVASADRSAGNYGVFKGYRGTCIVFKSPTRKPEALPVASSPAPAGVAAAPEALYDSAVD